MLLRFFGSFDVYDRHLRMPELPEHLIPEVAADDDPITLRCAVDQDGVDDRVFLNALAHRLLGGLIDDTRIIFSVTKRVDVNVRDVELSFCIVDKDGAKAMLIAERNIFGTPYVKTVPDWTKKDNLLDLPECRTLTY